MENDDKHNDDKQNSEMSEETGAGYGTSPMQIDEHIGPEQTDPGYAGVQPAGSQYGGAEYKGDERTGQTYNNNPELELQRHGPESMSSQEHGVGYSSGAGQSGAGFQGAEDGQPGLSQGGAFDSFDEDFRSHHELVYAGRQGYEHYQPAYRYGYDLASRESYRGRRWGEIEPEARRDWEQRYPNEPWDNFSGAVRHAWERSAGSVTGASGSSGEVGGAPGRRGQDQRSQRPSYQGPEDRRI